MAKNMFAKAKSTPKKSTPKKNDKTIVTIKDNPQFDEKLKEFARLSAEMDKVKTELEMAKSFVSEVAMEEYVKLVETKKSNPGSFILATEDNDTVMYLPTKRYIKIDEAAAESLTETYGEDVVVEETKYGFNTDVLMRNMDAISDALMESDALSQEDKDNLIEAITTYTVEKDVLDKVYTLSQEKDIPVADVIEDFQPVCQLKTPKLGKTE